ncbi:MAG: trans-sulfuration enzyme family protein [Thermodesulfobacteriota bacterium]
MASDNGDFRKTGIATKLVHSGEIEDESFKAVVTPIYRATTYASDEELYSLIKKHGKTEDPNVEMTDEELKAFRYKIFYARGANPNVVAVQRKMATLEGCDDAVAASSGMGAISSTLLSLIKGKKYIVSTPHLYGVTYSFIFNEMREMFGMEVIPTDVFLSKEWANKAHGKEIAAIYIETLSNPFLVIPPLDEIMRVRDELCPGTPIVVDNTFLTPVNFMPFTLLDPTRDLVLHSVTKYLAGHSDVIGGIVCGPLGRINQVWEKMAAYGCCLDAETAYYLERGLKTLHVRMERHNQNMLGVYQYLVSVSEKFRLKIFHPLRGQYPIPDFAKSLVEQGKLGGMITFNIDGKDEEHGIQLMKVLHRTRVVKHATSLGGVESLISMPYNMSQPTWNQQEALGLKRFRCLLRLSIGIEDVRDIIGVLDQALSEICN